MTRPTVLDNENVALLDLTPSSRDKPAWAIAAEKEVGRQMASLTASVMRRAGDDDTTAWDDVRKYVEGLERENATAYELIGKTGLAPYIALKDRAEAAEARIAELEKRLADADVVVEPFADGRAKITHANGCRYHGGHDCDCGKDDYLHAARAYMEGK